MKRIFMAGLLALLPLLALAAPFEVQATLTGKVVHVADGDTLNLLTPEKTEVRIRLWGIDAPESRQAFGKKAKSHAVRLAIGNAVTVQVQGRDRYGRTLGWVLLADGVALNESLVENGFAWWYRRYAPKAAGLQALEREARTARRGLWADPAPVEPWEWRRRR